MTTAIERIKETRKQNYGLVQVMSSRMRHTDWVNDLGIELGQACLAARAFYDDFGEVDDAGMFRDAMTELAANALAAIETLDFETEFMGSDAITSIRKEREYQIELWGGIEIDADRELTDWTTYVAAYLGQAAFAVMDYATPSVRGVKPEDALVKFRAMLVKVATLGLAAVEALDYIEEHEGSDGTPAEAA